MTSSDVIIRPAQEPDAEELANVWDDGRRYYASIDAEQFVEPSPATAVDPPAFVGSLMSSDAEPGRFARVAEVDGEVVGYIVARVDEPVANAGEQLQRDLGRTRGYVEALGVHRSVWRQGVGRALMNAAEAWAIGRGAEVMKTDTSLLSPVSVPFYAALGYDQQAVILRKPI